MTGTGKPLHPRYLASLREGALLSIKNNEDMSPYVLADAREDLARQVDELRARGVTPAGAAAILAKGEPWQTPADLGEGVGPGRAGQMLARLKDGPGLYVMLGGGKPPKTAPRPRLRLVSQAGARVTGDPGRPSAKRRTGHGNQD